jgi:L-fucose isomerase-like protein
MAKLKVGFVAGFMVGFSTEGLKTFEKYQSELSKLATDMDFELVNINTIISSMNQAESVRKELDDKNVDFCLLFHSSYIIGDFVFEIMKARAHFGLWAIEEISDEGAMRLASMVNISQNAGIAKNNFLGNPKKIKWFFGSIESKYFKPRFEITIKALKAIKSLENARVAQIGKLANGHINHMVDPKAIYKNLKVNVSRDYEVEDIMAMGEKIPASEVDLEYKKLLETVKIGKSSEEKIRYSVQMFLAINKIVKENNYSAVAFSCWPKLMPKKEMVGCLVNSMLNSIGTPGGCEADVLSTISMMVLSSLTKKPVATMDLPKFDEKDESLLLWHCGSAPKEMANARGCVCDKHYFAEYDESIKNCAPITDIIFKKSDVTVFRFINDGEGFYYFTGKFFNEDKKSFVGSRGWVNDLKLYQDPVKVMDLANTMILNGLPHHYPMVMENVGTYIEEMGYWLGLSKAKKMPYADFLYV